MVVRDEISVPLVAWAMSIQVRLAMGAQASANGNRLMDRKTAEMVSLQESNFLSLHNLPTQLILEICHSTQLKAT
jgi:hypothetical protein